MLKIVLVRPGSTDYDDQRRIQGSLDIPLNTHGTHEVQQLISPLKSQGIEVIYCSGCEPAVSTAQILAEGLDAKIKKLDRMCNLNHGLWQGLTVDEVKHKQPKVYRQWSEQPESVCPPEGETVAEARQRVDVALAKVVRKHKQGAIAIVAPEPLASIVRASLGRGELGDLWHAAEEHEPYDAIEIDPATFVPSASRKVAVDG
jgi:broad specificity phosphatase PhoE